ncbi:MAG TPA: DUF167 domain-containing protein [Geobacteraceae bacterium]|nr:DUF167 domain-containing protein [Geobacteraceae bacterium]
MKNNNDEGGIKLSETPGGVVFTVHVQPRASRNEVCGIHGEGLKLRLTAPPVEDAANRLCVEFLADLLGVAKSRITIIAGGKSRHKTIRVAGIDGAQILSLLKH